MPFCVLFHFKRFGFLIGVTIFLFFYECLPRNMLFLLLQWTYYRDARVDLRGCFHVGVGLASNGDLGLE